MSQHVLLTGGNGFIAVHVIVLLLQRGYTVTTTLRSESKATHLRNKFAPAVKENQLRFAIVEDITVPGAFDDVIKGNKFDAVLHTSSPVVFNVTDIIKDLLTPAIKGTTEILKSIDSYGPAVKRVVVTSSFSAVFDPSKGDRPGYAYSEKDWNPVNTLLGFPYLEQSLIYSAKITEEEAKTPITGYRAAKKLAEKAAWDFIDNNKPSFDLVTINPPMVNLDPWLRGVMLMVLVSFAFTGLWTCASRSYGPGSNQPI
ncbi:methylglyoxal reductase (NADPH-dependent) gre2 [Ceratobasidium sp. 394]|nr:methylglyoxal reductase (NADPH-dependent) gre2 [Ceratobasidium sp. 394]